MTSAPPEAEPAPLFLDANVLMYAIGTEHPYREPCRALLRRIERQELAVVTSVEVLQEILHRYRSLRRDEIAASAYRSLKTLCDEILPIAETDLDLALEILGDHPGITVRDAVHAACMRNRDLGKILSTDRHFDGIAGVTRVDPIDLGEGV